MITVREEAPADRDAVRAINDAAFGQPVEGAIVDALRNGCGELLSLVAELNGEVVGHILFSPVRLEREASSAGEAVHGMGLAPMAVAPAWQNKGVGSMLVREGLNRMKAAGHPFVVVLGHPEFYPRFGFERASKFGVRCTWEVRDEAFMIAVLDASGQCAGGTAYYRDEFNAAI